MPAVGGLRTEAAARPGLQALAPHQPAHAALAAGMTARPQFMRQAHAPGGATLLDAHGLPFRAQTGILLRARAGAAAPVVGRAARHAQQGAAPRDPMLRCQLLDVHAAVFHARERMPKDFF